MDRLTQLCDVAYASGDYGYIATVLRANHDEIKIGLENITNRANNEQAANRLTG